MKWNDTHRWRTSKWFWNRLNFKKYQLQDRVTACLWNRVRLTFKEEKRAAFERQGLNEDNGLRWGNQGVFRRTSHKNRNSFQFSSPKSWIRSLLPVEIFLKRFLGLTPRDDELGIWFRQCVHECVCVLIYW